MAIPALVGLWSLPGAGVEALPDDVEPAIEITRTGQYGHPFTLEPLQVDGSSVVAGQLEDGPRVDPWAGRPVRDDKPQTSRPSIRRPDGACPRGPLAKPPRSGPSVHGRVALRGVDRGP